MQKISKILKKKIILQRKFVKEASVFAQWRQDDAGIIKNCLAHDSKYWKINRFIREKEEQDQVIEIVKKHFLFLKNTHLYLCSKSQFPAISMNDFTAFSRLANFYDKNVLQSTIDRLFIASNFEVIDQESNPDQALIRFEFIELIVRIAIEKYKKPQ